MDLQLRLGADPDYVPATGLFGGAHLLHRMSVGATIYSFDSANNKTEVDLYFPIMSTLQFIFYMGWMKVAEAMLNPFGEDDDDFECNALIDRNITMVLMMVDQGYDRPPDLKKDPFWDDKVEPLYSEETAKIPNNPHKGSVSEVRLPESVHEIRMVPHFDDRDPQFANSPSLRRRVSVVPVSHVEHRQHRPSVGSMDMFRSFKNKIERSLSRGQLHDGEQPRKTVSHGHLPFLDSLRDAKAGGERTPTREKSFSNNAFVESQDDATLSSDAPKTKDVLKSSSSTNLKSPHDFQHHILDDVLEENEEEAWQKTVRKKSSIEPAITLTELRYSAHPKEEERKKAEQPEAVVSMSTAEGERQGSAKGGEFFIGQEDQR